MSVWHGRLVLDRRRQKYFGHGGACDVVAERANASRDGRGAGRGAVAERSPDRGSCGGKLWEVSWQNGDTQMFSADPLLSRIRTKQLAADTTLVFLPSLLAKASASASAGAGGKRPHLANTGHHGLSKKPKSEDRKKVLAELERKATMIAKHTSADAKETRELTSLTEKWAEAAEAALEELKRVGNSDKTMTELCKMMGIDPKLLRLEEEEEEEEEKKHSDNDES